MDYLEDYEVLRVETPELLELRLPRVITAAFIRVRFISSRPARSRDLGLSPIFISRICSTSVARSGAVMSRSGAVSFGVRRRRRWSWAAGQDDCSFRSSSSGRRESSCLGMSEG